MTVAVEGGRKVLHLDKNPAMNLMIPPMRRVFPELKLVVALRDPRDVDFLEQLTGRLAPLGRSPWHAEFGRELNATEARAAFGSTGLPVLEGKHVLPFRAAAQTSTRIERPALPREDLEAMGRALSRLQLDNAVAVIHLGEINREDVIPQMAEFCLQIEGVDWSVVSGLVKDRVVICVRNVGYVKSAGDIMKKLYDDIGSAGGHRAMAKAVVPLDRFKARFGEVSEKAIRDAMLPMIVDRDQIELQLH